MTESDVSRTRYALFGRSNIAEAVGIVWNRSVDESRMEPAGVCTVLTVLTIQALSNPVRDQFEGFLAPCFGVFNCTRVNNSGIVRPRREGHTGAMYSDQPDVGVQTT